MSDNKILIKSHICFLLVLGGLLLVAECARGADTAPVYKADFNIDKQPQMGLLEAYQNIRRELRISGEPGDIIQVTSAGLSFEEIHGKYKLGGRFDEVQTLSVRIYSEGVYVVDWITISGTTNFHAYWKSQSDAQCFVDAVMAIKYYTSKQSFDDPSAFAEFQQKAKEWLALPQKPPLFEEAHRFRVLADDAVQNKKFDKAANYYEQGLAIDPIWPAGQFNAAMIYGELEFYPLAVMHMKRYLALKPEDTKKYQDQVYIWEEKSKENDASSDN